MLKARITQEDYDALPDTERAHYKDTGDGFYVPDIEAVTWVDKGTTHRLAFEDVGALTTTLGKQKRQISQQKADHDALMQILGDVDPKEAVEAHNKLQQLGDIPAEGDLKKEVEQRVEAIRTAMERKAASGQEAMQEQLDAKDATIRLRESQLKTQLIDNKAIRALEAEGGDVEVLLPHIQNRCRCEPSEDGTDYVTYVLDDQRNIMYGADGQPAKISDLVKEYKQRANFAQNFRSTTAAGSGAGGGGSTVRLAPNTIRATDTEAFEANIEGIASGKVQVV